MLSALQYRTAVIITIPILDMFFMEHHLNKDIPANASNKYDRRIIGKDGKTTIVDVYRVLDAFKVVDPCLQHLIKKALCVGLRGHKDTATDLQDIIDSANEAIRLHYQKEKTDNPSEPNM